MSTNVKGMRAGAIRNMDSDTAYIYGYGVYDGDQPAPFYPFGVTKEQYTEAIMKVFPDITEDELAAKLIYTNPRITLDDGRGHVFGMQCWWGPEDKVRSMIGARKIVVVDP